MEQPFRVLALAIGFSLSVSVHAAPERIDWNEFSEVLQAAASVLVETFEYDPHGGDNPYRFSNGTLRSSSSEPEGSTPTIGPASCLGRDGLSVTNAITVKDARSTRIFSAFPQGTTVWGARLCFLNPQDVLEVTVVGGSGSLTFTAMLEAIDWFLGFRDETGLESVSIRNLGSPGVPTSNYYVSEITTAGSR